MADKEYQIYAVDFDGTLSLGEWPSVGPGNSELIEYLIDRKRSGDKIILWTCRQDKALEDAVDWCTHQGLKFDAINSNIPEVIALYGSDSRKISCDYYIDDKAISTNSFSKWKELRNCVKIGAYM